MASRSGPEAKGAPELQGALEELGAKVTIAACDVADRDQLAKLIGSIPKEHPLGAVIHAAGALADATIETLEPAQVAHVFAPKANAAFHLHELTKDAELSAFVLFSSAAGVLGAPGQANYAAANAFLDALAAQRQGEGLPATSIAWGLWLKDSGMTAELGEADLARLARAGIAALDDERGLALFDAALAAQRPIALALGLDRAGLRAQAAAGVLPGILRGLVRVPVRRRQSGSGDSIVARLSSLPEPEREAFVLNVVRGEVAAVLGHSSIDAVGAGLAFKELGFDSLAAVELRNRLSRVTGLRLPATAVFDHPTSARLAEYLQARIAPSGGKAGALESQEHEIRELLASIPLSRLRGTGLLDSLILLAGSDQDGEPDAAADGDLIDTMDVEELIRESIEGQTRASGALVERQVERAR